MKREQALKGEGLRERKRRDTMQRITEAAMSLFMEKGYDATTLDEIAAAADISRRTFFYYHQSKDDILLSLQSGMGEMLANAVRSQPDGGRPFLAMRDVLINVVEAYPTDKMIVIDKIMRSSASVQSRKSSAYLDHERVLFSALREKWPEEKDEPWIKLVAALSISAVRLSTDTFSQEDGARSLATIVAEFFDTLDTSVQPI